MIDTVLWYTGALTWALIALAFLALLALFLIHTAAAAILTYRVRNHLKGNWVKYPAVWWHFTWSDTDAIIIDGHEYDWPGRKRDD